MSNTCLKIPFKVVSETHRQVDPRFQFLSFALGASVRIVNLEPLHMYLFKDHKEYIKASSDSHLEVASDGQSSVG